ncbi:Broad specificity phosphatase PhoE [Sphingomonas gellani]|uniref:Broad specificity phosphatase PhoE n=1 Tax=Sphingomonas gellani TaxID=1166340 RepID=A0A1H8CS78_9SPHN|nr:histidine phosphatase family protein [Sphingomonas gellani]SEM97830.1 Broad specificity phosphatase PhoE [Sphingomonas gellani]
MTTRLILMCAGATPSTRAARFPDPAEALDEGGRAKVRAMTRTWPMTARSVVSPAVAAQETADLLGIGGQVEPALRDMDAGGWAGRGMEEIGEAALAGWLAAPELGAPGGEGLAAVRARVGAWLDALEPGWVVVVTHAAVIRAAVAHALAIPDAAVFAIDVAPLTRVALSRHGRWRLQELGPGASIGG